MNNDTKNLDKKSDKNEMKTQIFDFQYALELMKKKDINQYSENELKMFSEFFKNIGYNIDFFKFKKN
jgi:hypothetical protein